MEPKYLLTITVIENGHEHREYALVDGVVSEEEIHARFDYQDEPAWIDEIDYTQITLEQAKMLQNLGIAYELKENMQ